MLRTVQFWRIARADGAALPVSFPGRDVVRELQAANTRGQRRYRDCPDGVEVLGEGLLLGPHPLLAIYRTRRDNLPRLDDNGLIGSLPLTETQALAEPSFFAFLPRNIVGLLFNNDGPRAARLADYLNAKFGCDISLQPVYREDLAEVLDEMRMTAIELTVSSAQVPLVGGGDDWAELLDNASNLIDDGAISLKLSIGRGGNASARQARTSKVRRLVDLIRSRSQDQMGHFSRVKVQGTESGTKNPITVDLLNQKFVARVEVDAETLSDAERAAPAAMEVISEQWRTNRAFLINSTPPVDEVRKAARQARNVAANGRRAARKTLPTRALSSSAMILSKVDNGVRMRLIRMLTLVRTNPARVADRVVRVWKTACRERRSPEVA